MAVTNTAVFPQTPTTAVAVCTAACTTYSDATNKVLLYTAGANGGEICHLSAIPRATVTATQLQLYLSKDSGTTMSLVSTSLMAAYTMAQTTVCSGTQILHGDGSTITEANPLRLAAADRLYVAIGVALSGGMEFIAEGRDY